MTSQSFIWPWKQGFSDLMVLGIALSVWQSLSFRFIDLMEFCSETGLLGPVNWQAINKTVLLPFCISADADGACQEIMIWSTSNGGPKSSSSVHWWTHFPPNYTFPHSHQLGGWWLYLRAIDHTCYLHLTIVIVQMFKHLLFKYSTVMDTDIAEIVYCDHTLSWYSGSLVPASAMLFVDHLSPV